jgi:hypothetical protein
MRRLLAKLFNSWANTTSAGGKRDRARVLYRWASRFDPTWSVPWYNLGLDAKCRGRWDDSLTYNQLAVDRDESDEGAWWNLGIAATALHNWSEARRAWTRFGVTLPAENTEWTLGLHPACVRLLPSSNGEVVWGERLDPARIEIGNVPLPESGRHFRDIILNDGAKRTSGDTWSGSPGIR